MVIQKIIENIAKELSTSGVWHKHRQDSHAYQAFNRWQNDRTSEEILILLSDELEKDHV